MPNATALVLQTVMRTDVTETEITTDRLARVSLRGESNASSATPRCGSGPGGTAAACPPRPGRALRPCRSRGSGRRPRARPGRCSRPSRRALEPRRAVGRGRSHSTPANLSSSRDAKLLETSAWSAARMLTQNRRDCRIAANARDVFCGRNATSGGSSETLVNDWQVMPTGLPPCIVVMTVTPLAYWPSTSRYCAGGGLRGLAVDLDDLARTPGEQLVVAAEVGVDQLSGRPRLGGVRADARRGVLRQSRSPLFHP